MGAHSQPNGDPLLHFLPGGGARAAYYAPMTETLESVWDHPGATRWLSQTSSGKAL